MFGKFFKNNFQQFKKCVQKCFRKNSKCNFSEKIAGNFFNLFKKLPKKNLRIFKKKIVSFTEVKNTIKTQDPTYYLIKYSFLIASNAYLLNVTLCKVQSSTF